MNKNIIRIVNSFLLIFFSHYIVSMEETKQLVDQIVSIVFSSADSKLIMLQDLNRPTIFGKYRSLEECEFEKATLLNAIKHNIYIDDAMVQAYFESIQKTYNMSRTDVEQMFINAGYTIAEGIEQLRDSQVMNVMLQREVYENISISVQEAKIYYDAHPMYHESEYYIQRAVDQTQQNAEKNFSETIMLKESEIDEKYTFIKSMAVGEIVTIMLSDDEYELIKLIDKKEKSLLTFDEAYQSIFNELQQNKYEKLFEQFKQKMMQSVSIVRL